MFFLYGWRKKRIGVTPITHHSCSYCFKREMMFIETFKNYIHLFWIPVIPLTKTSSSYCGHCKQVLKKSEMPPDLKASTREIEQSVTTPLMLFIFPILATLLFLGLITTSLITQL